MAHQQNECDVSKVIPQVNTDNERQNEEYQRKIKRVLHFSDGDLVEYDTNEVHGFKEGVQTELVDPNTLQWLPWIWHQTTWFSFKLLQGCDYVGEALADFFGITSPKYQFAINEYHRQQRILIAESEKEQLQMGGWTVQQGHDLINISQPATKL
ncbi:protein FAM177A1 [Diachasma alloeum]|uniref:protein FAM177A1 n=1 Tax=Diachasma alloeum TaxID=454923 RepID=UPI0007381F29|nr:protein FAM177A1 [Diachasma alloeum]XP_015124362.1 protein FAM177A1 [Diachasma alloeum]